VARDAAGNEGRGAGAATVTRALWSRAIGAPLTAAAVTADGGAVLGVNRAERQLVKVTPGGELAWESTVGSMGIVGAPAVGAQRIFVGNLGGFAFAVSREGQPAVAAGCDTGDAIRGGAAIRAGGDWAFLGSDSKAILAIDNSGACEPEFTPAPIRVAPVISGSDTLALSGRYLRRYQYVFVGSAWAWGSANVETLSAVVDAPTSIDSAGAIWMLSGNGSLYLSPFQEPMRTVATLPPGPAGPIILADGSIVLGDGAGIVHRIDPATGLDRWSSLALGAAPVTALALAGTDADLIVPTVDGVLHALRSADGSEAWSARLTTAGDLKPGNLQTPAGASWSIGYFPSSDGTLYAVQLDGRLDATAPWPKAFHDSRNTNNAATPLP
jgi:outer membrane protein assembly factor BamB